MTVVALLGGIVGGIVVALFFIRKIAKLGVENETLRGKIAELEIHQNYVANAKLNGQKQYRSMNK